MKVLLADFHPDRAAALERDLAGLGTAELVRLGRADSVTDAVLQHRPDVVIVDMALPDRDSLEGLREVSQERPIVLFVDADDSAFMEAAIEAGVSSYNVVGASLPDIKPIIRTAVAMFRKFRQVEADLRRAEASLEERRVVDRAKALLIQRRRMSEPEAYRWLRRRAMDEGRRIAEIAADLLTDLPDQ